MDLDGMDLPIEFKSFATKTRPQEPTLPPSVPPAATKIDPEERRREEQRKARHDANVTKAEERWRIEASRLDWDTVVACPDVYKYSGTKVEMGKDPRRTEDYREQVVKGLGFSPGAAREGLTAADMAAVREVLHRRAAACWIESAPRTTLRHLMHDTVPTGPPVRTPPHHLKGEGAERVDE